MLSQRGRSALHVLTCFLLVVSNGVAGRMLGVTSERPPDIAEVIHRQLQTATYCVAAPNADPSKLQIALDWACGSTQGKVDCSAIQKGGSCYQPNSIANHASYAFDAYYVKESGATGSCSFGGLATLVQTDPSSGSCVYAASTASSSSSSSPPNSNTSPTSNTTQSTPFTSSTPSTIGSPSTSTSSTSSGTGPDLWSLHWIHTSLCALVVIALLRARL